MFGKKKMVKITEEHYDWLLEKVKERQEYKKDAQVAKWNLDIAMRGLRMTPKDWQLYKDYIKHNWYSLDEQTKETEMLVADFMAGMKRNEESYMAFAQFIKSLYDLEFYSKENKE
jgi:hypothetical protein